MSVRWCFLFIALFFPIFLRAQVVFTEVMYDLEGADTGREWVEVQNLGSSPADLSGYRFREGGTNHTLTLFQGLSTLAPSAVAVIADNPGKFLLDFPQFTGVLFDSSFSLSNTGELLVLKDSALVDMDQFTYSSDMGAAGDGKSLQKIGLPGQGGSWTAAAPTPGIVSAPAPASTSSVSTTTEESSTSASTTSSGGDSSGSTGETEVSVGTAATSSAFQGSVSRWPVKPQLVVKAGSDKKVTIGTPVVFEGEALGIEGRPLLNARYLWNFGDGATAEGQRVLHTYYHPGKYVSVLDVSSGEFSASDRLLVESKPAELEVRGGENNFGSFVEIENKRGEEVDLSYWQLVSDTDMFLLPKGTLVLPWSKTVLSGGVTDFSYTDSFALHYPNGSLAFRAAGRMHSPPLPESRPSPVPEQRGPLSNTDPSNFRSPAAVRLSELSLGVETSSNRLETETSSLPEVPLYNKSFWLYALLGLMGAGAAGVFWSGRLSREEIEIIESD